MTYMCTNLNMCICVCICIYIYIYTEKSPNNFMISTPLLTPPIALFVDLIIKSGSYRFKTNKRKNDFLIEIYVLGGG